MKLADRIANVEAAEPGDKHSRRYAREHESFADVVRPHVPDILWQRYLSALHSKVVTTESGIAKVFGCLERKGAPPISIEDINETAAKGWAGEN